MRNIAHREYVKCPVAEQIAQMPNFVAVGMAKASPIQKPTQQDRALK
jgi:hypothetical protein